MTWRVRLVCEEILDVAGVWPNGDAPDCPTVADVERELAREGYPLRVALDWGLGARWEVEEA